ncbi:restriction endonuclease subunit S [Enterobacter roggenkampii]|uniref:restriction endonuclease subunit S n=1 Tax=Enterobacter roggenkampii TaxID=1812935 RepID=UPI003315F4E7
MSFKEQRLEDLCELVIDCPHSTPKWTDKGFIVLRNQNIRNGVLDLSAPSFTDEDGYKSRIKRAKPRVNDIVFTREAPMGEVCLIPEGIDCCLGQRQVLLRANSEIDPYYLFWALQSPYVQHQISWNEGTGTTVSNVRIPVLKDLKIPRLGEHESWIAKTMTSLALKSQINEKINQTLEQMAQALFKSWFVDFEPVKTKMAVLEEGGSQEDATLAAMTAISGKDADALAVFEREHPEQYAELKATAELFPSAMQESELGEIPEGWRTENVENIINRLKVKNTFPADCIKQFGQHPVLEQGAKIYQGYHDEEPSFNASLQSPMFIFGDHTCVMHLSTVPFDISKNTLVLKGKGFNTYWTFFALKGKQKFQEYKRHWSDLKVKQVG